jgi:hypothetical protein
MCSLLVPGATCACCSSQGLPNLPRLTEDTDPGCFACHLTGFELFVDNTEGATLANAANLERGANTDGLNSPWLHYDDNSAGHKTDRQTAWVVEASGDMLHVFAEVQALFRVRPMRDVNILEQTLMCVPIDDTGRAPSFVWTLRAYVGGIQDSHLAKLEQQSGESTLDITTHPIALMPVGTKRVLVEQPVWKIVHAFRV